MGFFTNPFEKGKTNYEKAIVRLQEGTDTAIIGEDSKEKDGKFYLYNMEVLESEYNQFMDIYNLALESRNQEHEMSTNQEDLDMAA